jgi:hypothetical protein
MWWAEYSLLYLFPISFLWRLNKVAGFSKKAVLLIRYLEIFLQNRYKKGINRNKNVKKLVLDGDVLLHTL